jgi:hypothetical protein
VFDLGKYDSSGKSISINSENAIQINNLLKFEHSKSNKKSGMCLPVLEVNEPAAIEVDSVQSSSSVDCNTIMI